MKLRILIAGLIFGVAALAADNGAELFQKAVTQERAAGNLEEAIKLYQRVAKEFASDRALAAKALVQEARCYEKLGQDKAVKVYEQVARDFGDQREFAATASARLAVLKQGKRPAPTLPTTMTQRKIEALSPSLPPLYIGNTDGQRRIYKEDATGALMISDLAGGNRRAIISPRGGKVALILPSRDFSMVLMRVTKADGSLTNAVIRTDGTGYREIRGDNSCRPDMSWDGRYLLVCETQPDRTRDLLKISVVSGETIKLRHTDADAHLFSPDGRFIAYSPRIYTLGKIFVMPSEGGEPQLAVDHAKLLDWSRDGHLAITLDHSGSEALYLLPMKDGQKVSEPVFVRYGSFEAGRTTTTGSLVYMSTPADGMMATWLGTFGSDSRVEGWKRLYLSGSSGSSHSPTWSIDDSQIAYTTQDRAAGQSAWCVRVRDVVTGDEHELYRGNAQGMFCRWAAKHANLFCEEYSQQLTSEVFSVSTDSGHVERLGSLAGIQPFVFPSTDDRTIYMQSTPAKPELTRWEIGTQKMTTVDQSTGLIWGTGILSPDERWIARRVKGKIEIRPLSGGDWKPLVSSGATYEIAFSPDGNWLLYHDVDAQGKDGFFRVATAGGQPERLGDFPSASKYGFLWISRDGRKLIAETSQTPELWMLENFEPKQQAAR